MRTRLVRPWAGGLLALSLAATAGCSGPGTPSAPTSSPAASDSASSSGGSTTGSSSAAASPDGSGPPPRPTPVVPTDSALPLTRRLLPAGSLPGFNQEFGWTEASTRTGEPDSLFGTCQRFALTSIGADLVAVRRYRPTAEKSQSSAAEAVAQFSDDVTARRAYEVLKAWRARCQDKLARFETRRLGDLQSVPGGYGNGDWYLLTYGPVRGEPDAAHFDAQGLALQGNRIALLQLTKVGQDYNYPAGEEPMVAAVQAALLRL